ncbi:hypothetical protein J14TS5_07510 [Paenibacillus lautus]|uniref:hypothetical protein n=1 Tax=Paenibacillus lautus TaxID=1401 RepID=UPI001B10AAA6|nr:hypothetical protein [Paenibacillus lautus]GIO95665.1 hypothetical protein J14TS5_07510 [Paenibacillus lautus]
MIQIPKYWEDLSVLEKNREAPRAYYIPYADAESSRKQKRGGPVLSDAERELEVQIQGFRPSSVRAGDRGGRGMMKIPFSRQENGIVFR